MIIRVGLAVTGRVLLWRLEPGRQVGAPRGERMRLLSPSVVHGDHSLSQ